MRKNDKLVFDGEKLQRLRIIAGLSTADLAKRLGCTSRAIQNWERGVMPRPKYAKQMANIFHVAHRDLYLEKENVNA